MLNPPFIARTALCNAQLLLPSPLQPCRTPGPALPWAGGKLELYLPLRWGWGLGAGATGWHCCLAQTWEQLLGLGGRKGPGRDTALGCSHRSPRLSHIPRAVTSPQGWVLRDRALGCSHRSPRLSQFPKAVTHPQGCHTSPWLRAQGQSSGLLSHIPKAVKHPHGLGVRDRALGCSHTSPRLGAQGQSSELLSHVPESGCSCHWWEQGLGVFSRLEWLWEPPAWALWDGGCAIFPGWIWDQPPLKEQDTDGSRTLLPFLGVQEASASAL